MHVRLISTLVLLGCEHCSVAATPAEVRVIQRLYQQYLWEATDVPGGSRVPFISEARPELLKYLEPRLAEAVLQDRECAQRTQQVCRLDFSPMWASQDPGAKSLRIRQAKPGRPVVVSFTYPGNGERIEIEYELIQTPNGPRVRDVRYQAGPSLRKRLGVK